MERPLLKAISGHQASVLLIDEIDKSDEEFESFLLENLKKHPSISEVIDWTRVLEHLGAETLSRSGSAEFRVWCPNEMRLIQNGSDTTLVLDLARILWGSGIP